MKFINHFLIITIFLYSCSKKSDEADSQQMYPPYKLIKEFSKKINEQTDLDLVGYGINWGLPKNYQYKNGIGNFRLSFYLKKTKHDIISLESARNLLIFTVENLLQTINRCSEIQADLDIYPFVNSKIDITIHFKDENKIDLGQGIATIDLIDGKIKYEGYNITEYTGKYPAIGKHYTIHEESYADALDIVHNSSGRLIQKRDNEAYIPQ